MTVAQPFDPGDLTRTLHCIGDIHFGVSGPTARHNATLADVNRTAPNTPVPAARVMLGDLSNNGFTTEDAHYLAWVAQLKGDAPVYKVLGNHDVYFDVRTPAQAAAALGLPAPNYSVDLGFARLVCIFPGDDFTSSNSGSRLTAARLAWLDGELAKANKDVIVACHFGLYDTHGGDSALQWVTTQSGFFIGDVSHTANSDTVIDVLAAHPGKVRMWLSAHTHSNINTRGMVTVINAGGYPVYCVNGSTVVGQDKAASIRSMLNSLFLTYWGTETSDPKVELRWRDHYNRLWAGGTRAGRCQVLDLDMTWGETLRARTLVGGAVMLTDGGSTMRFAG